MLRMSTDFGMREQSVDAGKNSFLAFYPKGLWVYTLGEIIKSIKYKGYNITDVIITENSAIYSGKNELPIMVGILKNMYPLKYFITKEELAKYTENFPEYGLPNNERLSVTKEDLIDLAQKFVPEEEFEINFSHGFSFSIYGIGTFRCTFSTARNKYILKIRILNFILPALLDIKDAIKSDIINDSLQVIVPAKYMTFLNTLIVSKTLQVKNLELQMSHIPSGGLIIHAGATGTGKTTFLAGEIKYLSEITNGLTVTYEAPIEYIYITSNRILQYELGRDIRREEIFNHFLRSTPTVGFFHECKNKEDFELVVDLATRGHLVLTTLHASNVLEVFNLFGTLSDEFKRSFASILKAIVVHRLTLDMDGRIVPYYEIFYNNIKEARAVMSNFALSDSPYTIRNQLYEPGEKPYIMTFEKCLQEWVRNKVLSEEVARNEKLVLDMQKD